MYPSHASNLFRTLTQNVCLPFFNTTPPSHLEVTPGSALRANWTLSYIHLCLPSQRELQRGKGTQEGPGIFGSHKQGTSHARLGLGMPLGR